jgi:hypothetical protein
MSIQLNLEHWELNAVVEDTIEIAVTFTDQHGNFYHGIADIHYCDEGCNSEQKGVNFYAK